VLFRTVGIDFRYKGEDIKDKTIKERAEIARALKDAAKVKFPNLLQPSLFEVEAML
jgi:hypothetical protein